MATGLLIFPPQWSPFQPPLSLPSLSAWLSESGHSSRSLDGNINFYRWLLSEKFVEVVPKEILAKNEVFFDNYSQVCATYIDVFDKKNQNDSVDQDVLYVAVTGISAVLQYLSKNVINAELSLYNFSLGDDYSVETIDNFAQGGCWWASAWCEQFLDTEFSHLNEFDFCGLSCIGQEQLAFTALIGRWLKKNGAQCVLVGGTILSRLHKRTKLPQNWLREYFDVVVLNEGEIPLETLCNHLDAFGEPRLRSVPGIVYNSSSGIVSNKPNPPLLAKEIPIPDFRSLPLNEYFTTEITLPVLASRGCYWGKCEFCHHGMVYQDGFSSTDAHRIKSIIESLSATYGVMSFAFNDEALPPKTLRNLGNILPPHEESGFVFTSLIKFESYFKKSDWNRAFKVGFRSLYVGFESASEKNLRRMKKFTPLMDITKNLRDACDAGIWMHCFFFFGFPGETEAEAEETINYIIEQQDIIGSIGVGTFSLEHGAPIASSANDFKVTIGEPERGDLDVYYNFTSENGISRSRASELADAIKNRAMKHPKYVSGLWIPRELLLTILRFNSIQNIEKKSLELIVDKFVPGDLPLKQSVILGKTNNVNTLTLLPLLSIYSIPDEFLEHIQKLVDANLPLHALLDNLPKSWGRPISSGNKTQPS